MIIFQKALCIYRREQRAGWMIKWSTCRWLTIPNNKSFTDTHAHTHTYTHTHTLANMTEQKTKKKWHIGNRKREKDEFEKWWTSSVRPLNVISNNLDLHFVMSAFAWMVLYCIHSTGHCSALMNFQISRKMHHKEGNELFKIKNNWKIKYGHRMDLRNKIAS